ncbi:DUF924 family protein [Salinicola sp. LHM]|jgi:uncharacterized protein (DUF924 family)|uniref:DUF924 family protein n=2 Tax=Halomonadaceae TaxID=28256 RepID=UPI000B401595|nr:MULTISPECIES: DUF924 family protein [Salinicola]WQH32987.1 DUF924 family protein [Salinicola sp. LHM]
MTLATSQQVLDFWFEELTPKQWFIKSDDLDRTITERFGETLAAAARCECWQWRETPAGRVAEIVVLDQFSRNIHRDTPSAFAQDPLALALAQELISRGEDDALPLTRRIFAYMPFMHSESLAIHDQAVKLFDQPGMEEQLDYEHRHRAIVERFGRYPHRNAILGRESTPEEIEFLRQPGSSF